MKKKKIAAAVLGAGLIATVCGGVAFAAGNSEELLLKENQRYVYAYITSIQGNEITYIEVEESVITAMLEEDTESEEENIDEKAEMTGGMPDMGEMPDMSRIQGDGESGQRGFGGRQGAGRQENNEQETDTKEIQGAGKMQFGGMSAAVTTYIPVGVTVHTAADVSTTFSRLASGDLVKMLVEISEAKEDVIEEIWMLQ